MKYWKQLKTLPKRQQVLLGLFAVAFLVGLGILVWAALTGKIKPKAAGMTQISNTAYVTWDGHSTPVASNIVTVTIDNPPAAPTALTATAASSTQITLRWTASVDTDVASYNIYRDGTKVKTGVTGTTYSDTGLTPSTTYNYQISATDNGGIESVKSNTASATTQSGPSTNPNIIEAENMTLTNFQINPYSWASNGNVIRLLGTAGITGTATTNFEGTTGNYDIKVFYNDESDGVNRFKLYVNNVLVDEWLADQNLGITDVQPGNLVSHTKTGVAVAGNQQIKLEVIHPGGTDNEWGRTDKIELLPSTSSSIDVNLSLALERRSDYSTTGTKLQVCNVGQCPPWGSTTPAPVLQKDDISTDAAGKSQTFSISLNPGNYDFRVKPNGYLAKIISNRAVSNPLSLVYSTFLAGDFNNDNRVDGGDFSTMNPKWFGQDPIMDIDNSGRIDGGDFSVMNINWFQRGQ